MKSGAEEQRATLVRSDGTVLRVLAYLGPHHLYWRSLHWRVAGAVPIERKGLTWAWGWDSHDARALGAAAALGST